MHRERIRYLAMSTTPSISSNGNSNNSGPSRSLEGTPSETVLQTWSCVTCRRRKVRCDRREPCNHCLKNAIDCHYPVTGRLPRRSRNVAAAKSPPERQAELLGRLRRLEAVVTELTAQVEEGPRGEALSDASRLKNGHYPTSMPTWAGSGSMSPLVIRDTSMVTGTQDIDELDEEFGDLVVDTDGRLQVGKGFWSIFCDEVCISQCHLFDLTPVSTY